MKNAFKEIVIIFSIFTLNISCQNPINSSNLNNIQWVAYPKVLDYGNEVSYDMYVFDKNGENIQNIFTEQSYCNQIEWLNDLPVMIYSGSSTAPTFIKSFNMKNSRSKTLWTCDSIGAIHVSIGDIAISNQNKIAFTVRYDNGPGHIFTMNDDGTNLKELKGITGGHLTYIDNKVFFAGSKIFMVKDDGSDLKQISSEPIGKIFDYCISPDDNYIIYMYWEGPGGDILYQSDIMGNGNKPIFYLDSAALSQKGYEYINHPTFSPDGKKILFGQKSSVLTILDFKTHEYKQINVDIRSNIYNPTWIDNGNRILFSTNENSMFNLCLIDSDGANYKKIVSVDTEWFTFKASPSY